MVCYLCYNNNNKCIVYKEKNNETWRNFMFRMSEMVKFSFELIHIYTFYLWYNSIWKVKTKYLKKIFCFSIQDMFFTKTKQIDRKTTRYCLLNIQGILQKYIIWVNHHKNTAFYRNSGFISTHIGLYIYREKISYMK